MKVERTVKLDPDAAELLIQLAGSSRKQGEYLSTLIREKAREQPLLLRVAALEQELLRLKLEVLQVQHQPAGPLPPPSADTAT